MKIFAFLLSLLPLAAALPAAAISVAFPAERQRLPAVTNSYLIGAVSPSLAGLTLTINGSTTEVYRTGAFLAMVPVSPGSNSVTLSCGGKTLVRSFTVAAPPATPPPPPKPFSPILSPSDPRLSPPSAWQATASLFQNHARKSPDGDTAFFLPRLTVFRASTVKGQPKWLAAWFGNSCSFFPLSSASRLPDSPIPPASNPAPDITEGFPASPPSFKTPPQITVCIDPGHGGSDSGAVSPHGWTEKEVNLLLALTLRNTLQSAGFKVVMTRSDDSFPALYSRPALAYSIKADLFISIHHNASPPHRNPRLARHTTTYASNPKGLALATHIQREIGAALPHVPNPGARTASYAVCRNPAVPSCLVEADFINLPEGEAESWSPARHRAVSAAILQGILSWLYSK